MELAAQMDAANTNQDAPAREVFALLGDKWTKLILLILATGPFRHASLRRTIEAFADEEAISQRMLTLKLRSLERNGLIIRHATEHVPPQVDYSLSQMGVELVDQVKVLIDWLDQKRDVIERARSAFDATY